MAVSTLRGWGPILALPVAVVALAPEAWPRWLFMWVLAFAIFTGCKWLTWRRAPAVEASAARHLGYLFAWPGLDAEAFLRADSLPTDQRPSAVEWTLAAMKTAAGAALFWGAARTVPPEYDLLAGWVGMVGIVLMLHFGVFHLLSCAWRTAGVDARPLMRNPVASTSLAEFWGRRWNTAFRDLTHRFLYLPFSDKLSAPGAVLVGFVASGLVHDLVISLPAQGGYGWPTGFFALQGAGLLVERSRMGRRRMGLRRGAAGWAFAMLVLALPAYGLFHPPFVRNVMLPFMRDLGALA